MMTNLITFLQMTAKYQAAAMQLMVNEANVTAKQLGLNEAVTMPAAIVENEQWNVRPPATGVGGSVASSNYTFSFEAGTLRGVYKADWKSKVTPPIKVINDLAGSSLLDTNSAYEIASNTLASLSVDVAALERRLPPRKLQVRRQPRPAGFGVIPSGPAERIPLFVTQWGTPGMCGDFAYVEVLGTTKEMVELGISDSFLNRPKLVLTNAIELLGPIPPPRFFLEGLVGGKEAYKTIETPDEVEIALLSKLEVDETLPSTWSGSPFKPQVDRVGSVVLKPEVAKTFTDILLNFDSYFWGFENHCLNSADFGVSLRFKRGNDRVEVRWCFECDTLRVTHGSEDWNTQTGEVANARSKLVKAIQNVFPNDQVISELKLSRGESNAAGSYLFDGSR